MYFNWVWIYFYRSTTGCLKSISKVYAQVLNEKPLAFFDYDNFTPETDIIDDYAITQKLGRGKYSEVFEAIYEPTRDTVVLKVLKPVKRKKIKREIKILDVLKGGVNIIKLLGVIYNEPLQITALVFERIHNEDFKHIYLKLSEHDVRFYVYELLKALDYCHSKGEYYLSLKINVQTNHTKHQNWNCVMD